MNTAAGTIFGLAVMFGGAGCTETPRRATPGSAPGEAKVAAAEPPVVTPKPALQIGPRPQIRPAILADNPIGTKNMGLAAYDAKWSNYGAYLQRLIETVQIQWERILLQGKIYPPSGTTVSVKFIMDSKGKIARIVKVDNHSTEQGAEACASAITDRAPYGPWTDDMRALLGEEQEMTFTFYYQ